MTQIAAVLAVAATVSPKVVSAETSDNLLAHLEALHSAVWKGLSEADITPSFPPVWADLVKSEQKYDLIKLLTASARGLVQRREQFLVEERIKTYRVAVGKVKSEAYAKRAKAFERFAAMSDDDKDGMSPPNAYIWQPIADFASCFPEGTNEAGIEDMLRKCGCAIEKPVKLDEKTKKKNAHMRIPSDTRTYVVQKYVTPEEVAPRRIVEQGATSTDLDHAAEE